MTHNCISQDKHPWLHYTQHMNSVILEVYHKKDHLCMYSWLKYTQTQN